jgi:hypothetical protein
MGALKSNKDEIVYNLINSVIAGSLVFLGACATGDITLRGIFVAFAVAGIVAVTKFKDYWATQEKEYSKKLFTFI